MIESVCIRNFAVIRDVEIRPCERFNAITGETGAGKTVIAESLGFILGRRVSNELIRNGEKQASVSVSFSGCPDSLVRELEETGIEVSDGEVLIERNLFSDGKTSARINGRPVTLRTLSQIAPELLSLHGQRDTVMYLDPAKRLSIIDEAAGRRDLTDEYRERYARWSEVRTALDRLRKETELTSQKLDVLSYQYKEISSAKLRPGEDEKLEAEREALRSAEKIRKYADATLRAIYKNEKGITASYLALRAADSLEKIEGLVDGAPQKVQRLREIGYELEELGVSAHASLSDAVPENASERLDQVEERLTQISRLKRKYGCDLEGLLKIASDAAESIEKAKEAGAKIKELKTELAEAGERLEEAAGRLSQARTEAAAKVTEAVLSRLEYLDLPGVFFEIRVSRKPSCTQSGADDVDFLFSANKGEPPMPIEKCASGGELSRLVLSLKSVLAGFATGTTLFFDEIDAGISGSTSRRIGLMLKSAGERSQIICITHSAQIASLADRHLRVSKSISDGRTETAVEELDREGRITEISRILGGISVSDAQRRAAIDMIDNTEQG